MAETPEREPRPHGRRFMWVLLLVAGLIIGGFLAFAGAYTFVNVRSPSNARVSSALPGDLPRDVYLCERFMINHSVSSSASDGSEHFEIVGDCPVGALQLQDTYVNELEYRGWTVHSASDGTLTAYNYDAHQALEMAFTDSSAGPNQASMTMELVTRADTPPDGYPSPKPVTPSPPTSPAPR